jgi:predicted TIM-barrel fold metal-dependent hydrolase
VFGRYPYRDGRRYTPADAGLDEYRRVLATLALKRAVVVQPDIYTDNQATIDALRHSEGAWRGIARLRAETDEAELHRLNAIGVRGVRLNGRGALAALPELEALATRITALGWHIQLHLFGRDLPGLAPRLRALKLDVVFDHFARPDAGGGIDQDGFRVLLNLLSEERFWVKLSAPYRCTDELPPYPSVAPFARALVQAAPHRLLWGSDWPHSSHAGFMPNDGTLYWICSPIGCLMRLSGG